MGTVKNVLTLVQIPLNDSSYFNQSFGRNKYLGEKCRYWNGFKFKYRHQPDIRNDAKFVLPIRGIH